MVLCLCTGYEGAFTGFYKDLDAVPPKHNLSGSKKKARLGEGWSYWLPVPLGLGCKLTSSCNDFCHYLGGNFIWCHLVFLRLFGRSRTEEITSLSGLSHSQLPPELQR